MLLILIMLLDISTYLLSEILSADMDLWNVYIGVHNEIVI